MKPRRVLNELKTSIEYYLIRVFLTRLFLATNCGNWLVERRFTGLKWMIFIWNPVIINNCLIQVLTWSNKNIVEETDPLIHFLWKFKNNNKNVFMNIFTFCWKNTINGRNLAISWQLSFSRAKAPRSLMKLKQNF